MNTITASVKWFGHPMPKAWRGVFPLNNLDLLFYCGALKQLSRQCIGNRWVWISPNPVDAQDSKRAASLGAIHIFDGLNEATKKDIITLLKVREPEEVLPPLPAHIVARSTRTLTHFHNVFRAARTQMPVLLLGETGTGKEVCAKLIHVWSRRERSRFVPVNCAAIPNELIEGELFGYEVGAFSGAVRKYDGLFRAANEGTLFLDEIDDTPKSLQAKLLRVLEDRVVSRLGENTWEEIDFRLIAATNRDLKELIRKDLFGPDLYERLATLTIQLPALRERLDDLPFLIEQFIAKFYETESRLNRVIDIDSHAIDVLKLWPWPGNIRELKNCIWGILVNKRVGSKIVIGDLPRHLVQHAESESSSVPIDATLIESQMRSGNFNLADAKTQFEKAAIKCALNLSGGNASKAAQLLKNVGRGRAKDQADTLRAMMRRLGLAKKRRRKQE